MLTYDQTIQSISELTRLMEALHEPKNNIENNLKSTVIEKLSKLVKSL